MVASLPHDLLIDILLRVDDAAALFRCAAACKQWHGLVTDHTMLRRRWPEDACPSLAGFFIKNRARDQKAKVLVPTPWSSLGRRCRSLRSFVPTVPDRAVPLASRRGLLLVRLVPPRVADLDQTVLRLAVCNLLLGTCDELPPLMRTTSVRYGDYGCHCCAVLSGHDCRSGGDQQPPPFYKVLIITAGHEGRRTKFDIHTLSTDKPSWSTKRSLQHIWGDTLGSFCQTDAVVCHGIAYWLFRDDDERCFRTVKQMIGQDDRLTFSWLPDQMLPDRDHRPCLSLNSDGTLSVLQMQEKGSQIQIWRQEGQESFYGVSRWLHPQTIELMQPYWKKTTTQGKDTLSILGEKRGRLLVMDGRGRVYTADVETGAMKEVADGPHARPNSPLDVVLLEMDWPAFFVSRLGADSGEVAARRRRRKGKGARKTRDKDPC